jgi:DNA repair protein RecN (Recombination protein N)
MLTELRVRDLGVIADLSLVLTPGMTALTGETGAGKTLVVEAIELLVGGRADRVLVRPGAAEAFVEGRFESDAGEIVLGRAVPAAGGRSRAYIDGRMAPVTALAEIGAGLVDLHGQHAHQSLLRASVQRAALDAYAGTDLAPLLDARRRRKEIDASLSTLGGDARSRAREIDLLRFQLDEIVAAGIDAPGEVDDLAAEEERLATAAEARLAAAEAYQALGADGGAADRVREVLGRIGPMTVLRPHHDRLRALQAELDDAASDLRSASEGIEDDPERLAIVRARRQTLHDLMRKYGETLADVVAFASDTRRRLDELESHDARVAALEGERAATERVEAKAAAKVSKTRSDAAGKLAIAIEERLRDLALASARVEVRVEGTPPGDEVSILLAANAGEPALPLAKVASGGELARTMLAARLVLTTGPATLVFDEVDAGVGGAAATAVGRALAALAAHHQILVVTHLPQVAAFAGAHIAVAKSEADGRTVASATLLDESARVVELSRMLSGQTESEAARTHAEELLAAARQRNL